MRGLIFNSFTEFIKDKFGSDELDTLLQKDDYPNKGGFSALGNYNFKYMLSLVTNSASLFKSPSEDILRQFGRFAYRYLYNRLINMDYVNKEQFICDNPYDFLENLNNLHFDELQKIYPNAHFPEFDIERKSKNHIILKYSSFRDVPFLTYGLIEGCVDYYGYKSTVSMKKTDETKMISNKHYPVYIFEVKCNG